MKRPSLKFDKDAILGFLLNHCEKLVVGLIGLIGLGLAWNGVNALRSEGRSFLVITHYQRLLDHIKPDVVHIMAAGRIIKTGGPELALEVEENGYADILSEAV